MDADGWTRRPVTPAVVRRARHQRHANGTQTPAHQTGGVSSTTRARLQACSGRGRRCADGDGATPTTAPRGAERRCACWRPRHGAPLRMRPWPAGSPRPGRHHVHGDGTSSHQHADRPGLAWLAVLLLLVLTGQSTAERVVRNRVLRQQAVQKSASEALAPTRLLNGACRALGYAQHMDIACRRVVVVLDAAGWLNTNRAVAAWSAKRGIPLHGRRATWALMSVVSLPIGWGARRLVRPGRAGPRLSPTGRLLRGSQRLQPLPPLASVRRARPGRRPDGGVAVRPGAHQRVRHLDGYAD